MPLARLFERRSGVTLSVGSWLTPPKPRPKAPAAFANARPDARGGGPPRFDLPALVGARRRALHRTWFALAGRCSRVAGRRHPPRRSRGGPRGTLALAIPATVRTPRRRRRCRRSRRARSSSTRAWPPRCPSGASAPRADGGRRRGRPSWECPLRCCPIVADPAPSVAPATSPLRRSPAAARTAATGGAGVPVVAARRVPSEAGAFDLDEPYPRKSKTTLWVGARPRRLAALGLVAWIASSSGSRRQLPGRGGDEHCDERQGFDRPASAGDHRRCGGPAPRSSRPLPPRCRSGPASHADSGTGRCPASVATAPTHVAASPAPRANYGGPSPGASPRRASQGGQTIVRDVPF